MSEHHSNVAVDNSAIDGLHSFVRRHVGTASEDQKRMLEALGLDSLGALLEKAVPGTILLDEGWIPCFPKARAKPRLSRSFALLRRKTP